MGAAAKFCRGANSRQQRLLFFFVDIFRFVREYFQIMKFNSMSPVTAPQFQEPIGPAFWSRGEGGGGGGGLKDWGARQ